MECSEPTDSSNVLTFDFFAVNLNVVWPSLQSQVLPLTFFIFIFLRGQVLPATI